MSARHRGVEGARWVLPALAALAGLYLLFAASSTLWDRDEPRFGRAAVEMVDSGDYLVPRFNGELRPDKPVLVYWLMSLPVRLLGAEALAVRLPSIAGLVVALWFTFLIGRRLYDAATGAWALVILGTGLLPVVVGTAATADGVLLACIVAALHAFVVLIQDGDRRHYVTLSAALGLSMLEKGPVGPAVVLLTVLATLWFGKGAIDPPRRFLPALVGCLAVAVVMFLAWGLPANSATDGRLLELGLGHHVLERMARPLEGHGGAGIGGWVAALPFYLPAVAVGFFPWTILLPAALWALAREDGSPGVKAILWGWILPTFVLMSLVSTKLPHYVLPIYPALAIGVAALVTGRAGVRSRLAAGIGVVLAVLIVLLLVALLVVLPWWGGTPEIGRRGLAVAAVLGAGVIAAIVGLRRDRRLVAAASLAGTTCGTVLAVSLVLLPAVEAALKPAPRIAATVRAHQPAGAPVYVHGYQEPSLAFYIDQPADEPLRERSVVEWMKLRTGAGVMITTTRVLDDTVPDWERRFRVLRRERLVNYSSMARRQEVVVIVPGGG